MTLHQPPLDDSIRLAGKTATTPKPVVSRLNTRPQIGAPSPAELGGTTAPRLALPSSLAGDDVPQDTAPDAALPLAPADITVTATAPTAPAIGEAAPGNCAGHGSGACHTAGISTHTARCSAGSNAVANAKRTDPNRHDRQRFAAIARSQRSRVKRYNRWPYRR